MGGCSLLLEKFISHQDRANGLCHRQGLDFLRQVVFTSIPINPPVIALHHSN